MKAGIILLLIFGTFSVMAQPVVQGEYFYRKQEMVAGFNFMADGKFQFFYSYGAVDRNATGTFLIEGDKLKLKSDKSAGKDFTITAQSVKADGYTLEFVHPNKYLLKDIRCIFFTKGVMREAYSDDNGEVHMDARHCDTIFVQHPLYPDIVTLVKDENNNNNFFKLTLNPSLEQVSFKGIDFKILNDNAISCLPNYLMEMEDIEFIKQ